MINFPIRHLVVSAIVKHILLITAIFLACAITASPALCLDVLAPDQKTEQLQMRIGSGKSLVIWDVVVEGNRLVPSAVILHVIKSKRGDRFDREKVMEDLKAIVALGYFDKQDIRCTPELGTYGVILNFRVQENLPARENFTCHLCTISFKLLR